MRARYVLKIPGFYLLLILLLSGCVKDKVTDIVDNSYYTPEYSLPVGSRDFTMEDYINEYPGNLIQIPDTAILADTIDFLYYDSLFYNYIRHFDLQTVQTFNFSAYSDKLEYITSLTFRTNYVNGIPGGLAMQIYFLGAAENILDSVYKDGWFTILTAITNNNGLVTEKRESWKNDTPLSEQMIDMLPDVYYVRILTRLETENFNATKINYFFNQNLWVQLGIRIKLEIPLNEV